jgi:hypothetical protein
LTETEKSTWLELKSVWRIFLGNIKAGNDKEFVEDLINA